MKNKFINNDNIQDNYFNSYNNLYEDENEEDNIDYYYENDENIKQWIVDWYKKEEEEGRF